MHAGRSLRDATLGGVGIIIFLCFWEALGRLHLLGLSWPALTTVLDFLGEPIRWPLFGRALGATLASFMAGYASGMVAGLAFAALAHLVAPFRPGVDRLATILHAIPSIALAPLLVVLANRDAMPSVLAALSTFFTVYVAARAGFEASSPGHRDLMTSLGAARAYRFAHLDVPAALPAIASGLKLAGPAALIGVIVGEWFGAPRGLGVLIINAMENFQIALLWSAVLLAVITSILLFMALGWLERRVAERFR